MSKHGVETPVRPQGLVTQRRPRFLSLHRVPPVILGLGRDLWPQNRGPRQPLMTQRGGGEPRRGGEKDLCSHTHVSCAEQKKFHHQQKKSLPPK